MFLRSCAILILESESIAGFPVIGGGNARLVPSNGCQGESLPLTGKYLEAIFLYSRLVLR